jgi:Integral membrane protein (DUF2244)
MAIEAISGTVRVTVTPKPLWIALTVEAVGIAIFGGYIFRAWVSMSLWYRALLVWTVAGAFVAWVYQMLGAEMIEFDTQKLSISRRSLGWTRTVEYPASDCHELEWREAQSEGDASRLQCKIGRRTIKFGEYISEEEAVEILAALQNNLPEVAQQLLATSDSKKHFTALNLS